LQKNKIYRTKILFFSSIGQPFCADETTTTSTTTTSTTSTSKTTTSPATTTKKTTTKGPSPTLSPGELEDYCTEKGTGNFGYPGDCYKYLQCYPCGKPKLGWKFLFEAFLIVQKFRWNL
jgi:hypothetical protein